MKATELRKKSKDELKQDLEELLKEQFKLRLQKGTGQMSHPARFKELRREIARIKTVMAEASN
jgi:large subunit ribosomal protein L29